MITALLLTTLSPPTFEFTTVQRLLKAYRPSEEYSLSLPVKIAEVPLIVRQGSSRGEMLNLLEETLQAEITVSESKKLIAVEINDAQWDTRYLTAQRAIGKQLTDMIQARGSGAPTVANYENLLRQFYLQLGEHGNVQEFGRLSDEVGKYRTHLSGQLLLDLDPLWLAQTPPDRSLQTAVFERSELQPFRESLQLIQEVQRVSREYYTEANKLLQGLGDYELKNVQQDRVNNLIRSDLPIAGPITRLVVTSCYSKVWFLAWIRGYDDTGKCALSKHFSMPMPVLNPSLGVNPSSLADQDQFFDINKDYAELLRQEISIGMFPANSKEVWQLLKHPMSQERLKLYLDPLTGDKPFVAWLPDTFILSSHPFTSDSKVNLTQWVKQSATQPDGWELILSESGSSIRPKDPAGQLKRTISPELLNRLTESLHAQAEFHLSDWIGVAQEHGTNWMANRQYQADADLITRSGFEDASSQYVFVQEYAKRPRIAEWFKLANPGPITTPFKLQNVYTIHFPNQGDVLWSHDPASFGDTETNVTFFSQDRPSAAIWEFDGYAHKPVYNKQWLADPVQGENYVTFEARYYKIRFGDIDLLEGLRSYNKVLGPTSTEEILKYMNGGE